MPGRPAPLRVVSPIHKASRQVGEHIAKFTRAYGMEPGEGHLVTYVWLYGPCRITELVRVFGHKPSTLTGILDRLEERGLVSRELNEADRRSFLVGVTEAGAAAAADLRAEMERLEAEVLAAVEPREMAGFEAVMRAIGEVTWVQLRPEVEG